MSILLLTVFFGCKKTNNENDVSGGELVVIKDRSDICIGAYNFDTLNPITTESKSVQRIMNIIYEPLFTLNEEMSVVPVLAENYNLGPDGKSISINLKSGVKWQDGTNFSANDVIYTLSKLTNNQGIYSKTADRIESFTATGENSVVINFKYPEPDVAYLLTFPIISSNTDFVTDFVPVGTGSYKLASRSSTELKLEPNPLWHGGQVSDKKIVVKILKDEMTATNALNVKEVDAVALENYNQDTNIPKLNSQTETISTDNMVFLGFNTQSDVMSQNLRRSICEIIDKNKILENNAYGKGKVCELAINPSSWAGKLPQREKNDYSALLSSDGYNLNSGVYYKDGSPLSARILVNADNELKCSIAQGVCDMLKASGMEIIIESVSFDDYLKKINADDFDMFIGEVVLLPNNNPCVMLDSDDNYFNFDVSYLQDAKMSLVGTAERDDVRKALEVFGSRFYINPPYLPLYFKSDIVIYGSYVSGIDTPTPFDTFNGIEKWYFYDKNGQDLNEVNNEE